MTVDVVDPVGSAPVLGSGIVSDLFIIIGGYGLEDFSSRTNPLPPDPAYSGTGDLLKRVQSGEIVVPPGHIKKVIGLKGTLIDTDVDMALSFIMHNFDPLGKIIVYGHSMGGAAVLRLCRKIDLQIPFFGPRKGLTSSPDAPSPFTTYQWSQPPTVPIPPPCWWNEHDRTIP